MENISVISWREKLRCDDNDVSIVRDQYT